MTRVALVTVRYGNELVGGAESLARQVANRLVSRHDVTVLTTCANDHITWANAMPSGEDLVDGVRVLRFPVRRERELHRFAAIHRKILSGAFSETDETEFLEEQGPDVPDLYSHLETIHYDVVIFFTALYLPSVRGLPLVADHSVLVPTLHDEASVRLSAHRRLMASAAYLIFLTAEERDLAPRLFGVTSAPSAIAGVGVAPPAMIDVRAARERFGFERPYLLYAGRIDVQKGCPELFQYFTLWSSRDSRADLVLCGTADMDLPRIPRMRHEGFVNETDRWILTRGALATVIPSRNESLSLAALESLAVGTPILVTADSPVLVGHARRSRGGIAYRNFAEFSGAVDVYLAHSALREAMGRSGRGYVEANYTWAKVEAVFEAAIDRVATKPRDSA